MREIMTTTAETGNALPSTTLQPEALRKLIEAFLSGKSERTLAAYRSDLADFADFIGAQNMDAAAQALLASGPGNANLQALEYRAALEARKLAPATIRRRLSALRSLVKLARVIGLTAFELEVDAPKSKALRDTRGCGLAGFRKLLVEAGAQSCRAKALRDIAILRLAFDLGLRRSEITALDCEHVELEASRLWIMAKGSREREPLNLPDPTREALAAWMEARGSEPGALFTNFDHAGKGKRLTGSGVYAVIRMLGSKAGVNARPHGIRHAATTEVLNLSGGDLRLAQAFARHANPATTIRYDDNRQDKGGEAAKMLARVV